MKFKKYIALAGIVTIGAIQLTACGTNQTEESSSLPESEPVNEDVLEWSDEESLDLSSEPKMADSSAEPVDPSMMDTTLDYNNVTACMYRLLDFTAIGYLYSDPELLSDLDYNQMCNMALHYCTVDEEGHLKYDAFETDDFGLVISSTDMADAMKTLFGQEYTTIPEQDEFDDFRLSFDADGTGHKVVGDWGDMRPKLQVVDMEPSDHDTILVTVYNYYGPNAYDETKTAYITYDCTPDENSEYGFIITGMTYDGE